MTPEPERVAVLGAGNWGTTLAHLAARNGHRVLLWTRTAGAADEINQAHRNSHYAPNLEIASTVRATASLEEAVASSALLLFVLPSQAFREVCRQAEPLVQPNHLVLHATKGLEEGTHRRMSQILMEETCLRQFGVICGPNIAPEIAAGMPAGTTIASHFPQVIETGRRVLSSPQLMVFATTDVIGTELAGALKNVVAIAAGIAEGLQVGENAKAFLVARGMAEIIRLASPSGAHPATFSGLVGVGDLVVTCASKHSRNHRVGVGLAAGKPLSQILSELGMVAEGVHAARAAHELAAANHLDVPLMEHVYRVLYEKLTPRDAIASLMRLPAGRDVAWAPH